MNLPSSVSLVESFAGYPVLVIKHPAATGRIALNGAHVMEWTPAGQKPALYLSPKAVLESGQPIRGGVPICWPWFGPHPTEPTLPAHGFVRGLPWIVSEASESPEGVRLVLSVTDSEETQKIWPYRFQLRFEVTLGAELNLALHIKNSDSSGWTMTGALHTYLCVDDVTQASVTGLDGRVYVESRLSPERITQQGAVTFDREVDRLFESTDTLELTDPKGGRKFIVEKSGSQSSVVWNPWIEKSKRLADLPDDAYPFFVCLEAANAGTDIITVPPAGEHVLSQRITVRPF